jgi:hypothetical protein
MSQEPEKRVFKFDNGKFLCRNKSGKLFVGSKFDGVLKFIDDNECGDDIRGFLFNSYLRGLDWRVVHESAADPWEQLSLPWG